MYGPKITLIHNWLHKWLTRIMWASIPTAAILIAIMGNTMPEINLAEIKIVREQPKEMVEWILDTAEKAGMNRYEVYSVLRFHESGFNPNAKNFNPPSKKCPKGSWDFGVWQLNDCHQPQVKISCSFDYKCATHEAIKIWKKYGWTPWIGARTIGLK